MCDKMEKSSDWKNITWKLINYDYFCVWFTLDVFCKCSRDLGVGIWSLKSKECATDFNFENGNSQWTLRIKPLYFYQNKPRHASYAGLAGFPCCSR